MATLAELRAELEKYPGIKDRILAAWQQRRDLDIQLGRTRQQLHADHMATWNTDRVLAIGFLEVAWLMTRIA